jgi:hypothetical protein
MLDRDFQININVTEDNCSEVMDYLSLLVNCGSLTKQQFDFVMHNSFFVLHPAQKQLHGQRHKLMPYSYEDYEKAKKQGFDLDNWDDYVKFYELGEHEVHS